MTKLIRIPTHNMSETDWLLFRKSGIGGSEAAAAMGKADFEPMARFYLGNIDEPIVPFSGNEFTAAGIDEEPIIRQNYQYLPVGGNVSEIVAYKRLKRKVNHVRQYRYIIKNPKYDWLFANIDGRINNWKDLGPGVLECKNITSHRRRKYKTGIATEHYIQIQTYLLITGWKYAQLCYKTDGYKYEIIPFEPNPIVQEAIIETTRDMWARILKARAIKDAYDIQAYFNVPLDQFTYQQLEGIAQLQELEPEIGGSKAEVDWIKQNIIPSIDYSYIDGDQQLLELAQRYLYHQAASKNAEEQKNQHRNQIIRIMGSNHEVLFDPDGVAGKITNKPDTAGRVTFKVSPKLQDLELS